MHFHIYENKENNTYFVKTFLEVPLEQWIFSFGPMTPRPCYTLELYGDLKDTNVRVPHTYLRDSGPKGLSEGPGIIIFF